MGLFTRKAVNSEEYEKLVKRLVDVEQTVRGLLLENDDLRNKVLRKIQNKTPERKFMVARPAAPQQ